MKSTVKLMLLLAFFVVATKANSENNFKLQISGQI